MATEKPCCVEAAARMVKKLTLPDGFQVGILNLESILKGVADLKLVDNETIKKNCSKGSKFTTMWRLLWMMITQRYCSRSTSDNMEIQIRR